MLRKEDLHPDLEARHCKDLVIHQRARSRDEGKDRNAYSCSAFVSEFDLKTLLSVQAVGSVPGCWSAQGRC